MACRLYDVIELGSRDGCHQWSLACASFAPYGRAFLQISVDDYHAFAILLGRDGNMDSKRGLATATFLTEESDCFHEIYCYHGAATS